MSSLPSSCWVALAAAAALGLAGCSFQLTPPPKTPPRAGEPVVCDTGHVAPAVDAVGAVAFAAAAALSTLGTLTMADTTGAEFPSRNRMTALFGTMAAGYGVAAIVYSVAAVRGFTSTHRCRELKQAAAERRPPRAGMACGAIVDRPCGAGLRCVENRCERDGPAPASQP